MVFIKVVSEAEKMKSPKPSPCMLEMTEEDRHETVTKPGVRTPASPVLWEVRGQRPHSACGAGSAGLEAGEWLKVILRSFSAFQMNVSVTYISQVTPETSLPHTLLPPPAGPPSGVSLSPGPASPRAFAMSLLSLGKLGGALPAHCPATLLVSA